MFTEKDGIDALFRRCKPEDANENFFSLVNARHRPNNGAQRIERYPWWGGEQLSHLNIDQTCRRAGSSEIMDIDAKG